MPCCQESKVPPPTRSVAAGLVWDSPSSPGPWVGAPRSPSKPFHWISATSSQSRLLGTAGPERAIQGARQRGSAHPMPCNKGAPSAPPTQPVPNLPDHETLVQSPQHSMEPRSPGACSVMVLGQGAPSPAPGAPGGCLNKAESAWDTPLPVLGSPCQHGPGCTCQGLAGSLSTVGELRERRTPRALGSRERPLCLMAVTVSDLRSLLNATQASF